jgi:hypothetical protein
MRERSSNSPGKEVESEVIKGFHFRRKKVGERDRAEWKWGGKEGLKEGRTDGEWDEKV